MAPRPEMTEKNHIQIFEKSIASLNNDQCIKIIDKLNIDNLNELKSNKANAAAIVSQTEQLDFAIMYFFRRSGKICGFQYQIRFMIGEESTNILCDLFTKYVLRMQRMFGVKQVHTTKNLCEYYTLQIKGYKDHLKKQKQ